MVKRLLAAVIIYRAISCVRGQWLVREGMRGS